MLQEHEQQQEVVEVEQAVQPEQEQPAAVVLPQMVDYWTRCGVSRGDLFGAIDKTLADSTAKFVARAAADSTNSGSSSGIAASESQPAAAAKPKKQRNLMNAIQATIDSESMIPSTAAPPLAACAEPQQQRVEAIQAMIPSEAAPQPAESEPPKQPSFVVRAPSGIVVTPIVQNYEGMEASKGTTPPLFNYRRSSSGGNSSSGGSRASVQGVETPARGSDAGLSRQSSLSSTSSG